MQEVTYVNVNGEAIRFGGTPPYVLERITGTEGAEPERKTLRGSLQAGARTVSLLRRDRIVEMTFHLIACARRELYRERAALSSVLSPSKGFCESTGERGRVIYENDLGKWWTWAVPAKPPQWPGRVRDIHPSVKVSFSCDSPYWFSMTESVGSFERADQGFQLPFRFPARFGGRALEAVFVNNGHAPAPVRITIWGQGERLTLFNRATGARISLASPLPAGAALIISTDPEELYVVAEENGVRTNAYGYLDVETPVSDFQLAPGENLIAYESGDAAAKTSVSLAWRNRFEGV